LSSGADNYARFKAVNTEVVGISANAPFSQKAFADFLKLNYPLLSDQDQKVMKSYGVFDKTSARVKRSYFIIDKEGIIRFKSIRPSDLEQDLLSTDELLREVNKINKR
jgi:peroxiredoxin